MRSNPFSFRIFIGVFVVYRFVDHKNVENRCLGCRSAQCTDRMQLRLDYVYTPSDNPLLMSVFGEQCTRKCPGEPLSMYTACVEGKEHR